MTLQENPAMYVVRGGVSTEKASPAGQSTNWWRIGAHRRGRSQSPLVLFCLISSPRSFLLFHSTQQACVFDFTCPSPGCCGSLFVCEGEISCRQREKRQKTSRMITYYCLATKSNGYWIAPCKYPFLAHTECMPSIFSKCSHAFRSYLRFGLIDAEGVLFRALRKFRREQFVNI